MNPKLRKFLELNGLSADATDREAMEFYRQLQADGVMYSGPEEAVLENDELAGQRRAGNSQHSAPQQAAGASPEEVRAAIDADRIRCREIEEMCSYFNLPAGSARTMIDEGLSIDNARAKIFDQLRKNKTPIGAGAGHTEIGIESLDRFRAAVRDGLALRAGVRIEKPAEGANEFRGQRLETIARECLERAGERIRGLNPDQIARRALSSQSTSDFPLLMSNVANQRLVAAYIETPSTYRQWTATGDANDFKPLFAVSLSNSPDLEELDENGEFKTAKFREKQESYKITTKGIKVPFTRQMLINDDLRAFTRIPGLIGAAAKRMENQMVYGLLLSNPVMASDGKALFSVDHENLGAGAALIDSATLSLARAAMRKQKGAAGETLGITPAYILAGVDEETNLDIILRSAALPTEGMSGGVINPWNGKLTPITEPLLDVAEKSPFYLLASPGHAPVIEVSWLMGNESPYVDDEMEFGTGNVNYICRHDFGCGLVDYLGAYMVPRA